MIQFTILSKKKHKTSEYQVYFRAFLDVKICRENNKLTTSVYRKRLVRKRRQSCIRNTIPYCSLRITFQSITRLSSLLCFKDIIPKEISSHLLYKFTCICCNAAYYGESQKHFFVRALNTLV